MSDIDEDLLIQAVEYLWELKCINEWRRDTTLKNINWLDDLQSCINDLQRIIGQTP